MASTSPGDTWECYAGRADDPDHDWPENPFGDRYVRFYAVVAEVHDDSDSIELDEPPLWRKRFER